MAVKIICIKKDNGNHENPYVAITSLKWKEDGTGNEGETSRIKMYEFVEETKGVAYVVDSKGNKANLIGAISSKGNKYVKTIADDVTSDNLLKLPECK